MNLPMADGVDLEICYFMEYLESSPDAREGFNAYRENARPRSQNEPRQTP